MLFFYILIAIAILILIIVLLIVGCLFAVTRQKQHHHNAWEYWEKTKTKKWADLTDEEKKELIIACQMIDADCGACERSDEEIMQALKEQLPVLTPKLGLSYSATNTESPQETDPLCTSNNNAMIQEDSYIPKQGIMTAVCRANDDMASPQILVGATYRVDYLIIAQSRSFVCLSEFPEMIYNSVDFTFYIGDGRINIIHDYLALKRLSDDTYRGTTLMICNELSADRIAQIKQRHNNIRIITRSELLQ